MYDSLYPEPMDATTRDGQTELRCEPFGPAGTAAVEMEDGTVWEVDHADPAQLVALVLEGDLERSRLARDLLGPERFDWTCAQLDAQRAAKRPGKRLQAKVPGGPGDRWATSFPRSRGGNDLSALVGTAVLMADVSTDETLSPLVRLAAGLEFVARVRDGYLGSVFEGAVETVVRQMYEVALQVTPGDFEELGRGAEKPLYRFESVAQWALREVPSLQLPITKVLDLLHELSRSGRARGDAPRAASMGERQLRPYLLQGDAGGYSGRPSTEALDSAAALSEMSMPSGAPLPEDFIEVEMPDAGQLVVRVSRQHDGKWVRVLRTSGLVPLALVPLMEDGMLLEALAVVPADLEVADLVVEVVEADLVAGAERPLALVSAAVEAGRAAARYERLGRSEDAAATWRECSRLWNDAADNRRAVLAAERASASAQGHWAGRIGPLLADELQAASMGERPGRR